MHHKRTSPALNYTLGNTLLNVVNSHSYLGVTYLWWSPLARTC